MDQDRSEAAAARPSLARSEAGVALIEYALLLALIAISLVAAFTTTGAKVENKWNGVDQAMPGGTDYQS